MKCQFCGQEITLRSERSQPNEAVMCDWCGRRQEATAPPETPPAPAMPFSGSAPATVSATPTAAAPPATTGAPAAPSSTPKPLRIDQREAEIRRVVESAGQVIAADRALLCAIILLGLGAAYSLYNLVMQASEGASLLSVVGSVLSFSGLAGALTLRKWGMWLNMILCGLSAVWLVLLVPVMLLTPGFFSRVSTPGSSAGLVADMSGLLVSLLPPVATAIALVVVLLALNLFIMRTFRSRSEKFA